jgi:myo-inositol-1(or 4)-monophosphatase
MNDWLISLADEAGRMALEFQHHGFDVKVKPDNSPVTTADLAIDRFLHDAISAQYPEDCILSEESEEDPNRLSARRVWIADPIDGTAHFVAGRDGFGTLIALCIDGVADECVAIFPMREITLYAKRGEGAFVNGRPVRVSRPTDAAARIATHAPRYQSLHTAPIQFANNAIAVFKVIAGEIDGCIATTTASTGEHDYAWASCAVEAAGGMLTDLDGAPLRFNKPVRTMPPVLVCSNGSVHEKLRSDARALSGLT